jgi:hypothetical protein
MFILMIKMAKKYFSNDFPSDICPMGNIIAKILIIIYIHIII